MTNYGPLDIGLSSIGRTNKNSSEEEEIRIRIIQLAAESLLQSGTVDGDLRRREETVDLIGRCKIALAPHKRLSPDVLRSIFHFCGEARVQFPLVSKRDPPCLLRITHVCSAWRQLALETPALWSDISIYLSDGDGKRHDKTLFSARQWLDRAQDMRRSLFIIFTDIDIRTLYYVSPHLHDSWNQLLEFMARYRLEELDLAYPINHVALKLPDHAWSSIEHLSLKAHVEDDRPSGRQQLFSNFGKLSNLRHLKIFGSHHLDGMDRIVPWHQLRTFEVWAPWDCPVTPSSCLNVLHRSRFLERCRITLSKESSFTSSTEEKIVLANMDCLKVEFWDGLAVPLFLRPLVIPNITSFTLERADGKELSLDMLALSGIIQRSDGMRQIRYLKIDTSSSVLQVGVLLELLPSLESISIKSGRLTDNAIERLSIGKFGPRLRDISSSYLHNADKILSMVESRYQNATKPSIEDLRFCSFENISISCSTPRVKSRQFYRKRVELLSKECDASIYLEFAEDRFSDSDDYY